MGPLIPAIEEEEDTSTCAPEGTTTVEEFCGDLTPVETKFAELFAQTVPDFALPNGFTCDCAEPENDTFNVTCAGTYESLPNDPDFPDGPESFTFEEYVVFKKKASTSTYWVPSEMGWGDEDYLESYKISLGQRGLYDCNFDGTSPSFCALCADGISIQLSDAFLTTCEEEIAVSFWAVYIDQVLATEICPPLTTDSPSGTPSSAAWSWNPTVVSVIFSALVGIMFVAKE